MSEQGFLVSARKYRPQLFSELVAQEHVTDTLQNAVRLDRLAHAYLFTGPRGVGKTTAARILAKAINCTTPPEDRSDAAEPCRTCDSCASFEQGRNMNIIEIDAASNNRVDDIRELRETVRIPPQGNRKKVYIVDEVHMLSASAFNALLKTLEEPPPHALFIFATTEPHKVLATIQSRCQRFDFRRIPVAEILRHLRAICKAESITADEGSLMLVARKADGALRDALSVFDQAVSLCGSSLEIGPLAEALGVVDEDVFFELSDHVASGSGAAMLDLVERVIRSGYDLQEFLDGVAEHFRNLLVALTMPDTRLIEASQATRDRYRRESSSFDEARVLRLLALVDQTMERVRTSRQPRLRLELALLKMAAMPATIDLKRALGMLDGTEPLPAIHIPVEAAVIAPPVPGDGPPKPAATMAAPDESKPAPEEAPAAETPASMASPPEASAPEAPSPGEAEGEPVDNSVESTPPPAPQNPEDNEPPWSTEETTPPTGPSSPPPAPELPFDSPTRSTQSVLGQPALFVTPKPEKGENQASAEDTAVAVATDLPVNSPAFWEEFVIRVMDEKIHVGSLLQRAHGEVDDGVLHVIVPDDFSARVLREEESLLLQIIGKLQPGPWTRVRTTVRSSTSDEPDEHVHDPEASLVALCEEYPALKLLMERFGGEIVW